MLLGEARDTCAHQTMDWIDERPSPARPACESHPPEAQAVGAAETGVQAGGATPRVALHEIEVQGAVHVPPSWEGVYLYSGLVAPACKRCDAAACLR